MNIPGNVAYAWRPTPNRREKQALARETARHVPTGVSLAFSIGTTPASIRDMLARSGAQLVICQGEPSP